MNDPLRLLGDWTWSRVIDDHREREQLSATGRAVFALTAPGRIEWREEGTLFVADPVVVTTTRLLTRDRDGSWLVDFADGRDFHPWLIGADLVHDCAPDVYRGRVDGSPIGDGEWEMRWAAVGPTKDYQITTVYRRATTV